MPKTEQEMIVFKQSIMDAMKTSIPTMLGNDTLDKILTAMFGRLDMVTFERLFLPLLNLVAAIQSIPGLAKLSDKSSDKVEFVFKLFEQFLLALHEFNKKSEMSTAYRAFIGQHLRTIIQFFLMATKYSTVVKTWKTLDVLAGTCDHRDGSVLADGSQKEKKGLFSCLSSWFAVLETSCVCFEPIGNFHLLLW